MKIIELKQVEGDNRDLIIGMDTVGIFPVIGPLMIGLVAVKDQDIITLESLKIKEAKDLSRKLREEIASDIKNLTLGYAVAELPASLVDKWRYLGFTMNQIVINGLRFLIRNFHYDSGSTTLQIDSADEEEYRYARSFYDIIKGTIEAKNKAEEVFTTVNAASIIARVAREKIMDNINLEMENFDSELPSVGLGYPNEKSRVFLRSYYKKYKRYPVEVRKTWDTAVSVKENLTTRITTLDDFF